MIAVNFESVKSFEIELLLRSLFEFGMVSDEEE